MLQKFIFIPLDIFKKTSQNKPIKNKTEAWLTFLSSDEPERIIELISCYPEFKPMYDNIYELCRNIEGVMNMFSEELYILDRNTELYMMDEMQKEIDEKKKVLEELNAQLDEQTKQLDEQTKQLDEQTKQLDKKDALIKHLQEQLKVATM